jgi:hypothetical protein
MSIKITWFHDLSAPIAGIIVAISKSMRIIIIISKCLRVTNSSQEGISYEFHFKGVYAGELIKKIILTSDQNSIIKPQQELMICAGLVRVSENTLYGKIIKFKRLDECHDLSSA